MSWADEFQAFSAFHAVTAGVCVIVMVTMCALGVRWRGTARERTLAKAWGWGIVLFAIASTVYRFLPGQFTVEQSLPLHLCRLTVWTAALAMLTGGRRWRALTYFWGLGLSVHGMVTPVWTEGYASFGFWMFWVAHLQIVGTAIYDLTARRYRPTVRDWGFAALLGLVYAGVVIAANVMLGTNYNFLGATETHGGTIAEAFGDWPIRAVWMTLAAQGWFIVMLVPFVIARKLFGRAPGDDSPRAVEAA